jgi:hypothetical protein
MKIGRAVVAFCRCRCRCPWSGYNVVFLHFADAERVEEFA